MSDNLPQVEAALQAYMRGFDMRIGNATLEISQALEGFGKRQIKGQRPEGEKAVTGQPPMNRTGDLRRSIRGQHMRLGYALYEAVVGADMVYARAVEVGAPYNPPSWQNNERFPYLQPALEEFAKTNLVVRILRKHLGVK
jgi:DNA-directed RNA polymerase subunit K/omega